MARVTRKNPVGLVLVGIIMVLLTFFMINAAKKEKAMQDRCTANATATITTVSKEKRSKKSGKRRTTYYVYRTGYEFDVDTATYNGSTTLNHSSTIGDTIPVHYNPNDPGEHYTNNEKVVTAAMVIPGFIGVIGVIMIIAGITSKKQTRSIGGNYNNMGIGGAIVGAALSNSSNNYNSYNNNGYNNQSSFGGNNGYNSYNNQNGFGGNNNYNGYNNQNSFGGNNNYNGYNNQSSFGGNNNYNGYNNQSSFGGNNSYNGYNNQSSFGGNNNYNSYNNDPNGGYNDSDFNQLN